MGIACGYVFAFFHLRNRTPTFSGQPSMWLYSYISQSRFGEIEQKCSEGIPWSLLKGEWFAQFSFLLPGMQMWWLEPQLLILGHEVEVRLWVHWSRKMDTWVPGGHCGVNSSLQSPTSRTQWHKREQHSFLLATRIWLFSMPPNLILPLQISSAYHSDGKLELRIGEELGREEGTVLSVFKKQTDKKITVKEKRWHKEEIFEN